MNENQKCCCCFKAPMIVSGILFAIVAIWHIARGAMGWEIIVNGEACPVWYSWAAAIVAAAVSLWNFCACCCKKCGRCKEKCQRHIPPTASER